MRRSHWRLIVDDPAPGAWNMAVDETLVESVRAGAAPTLRLYRWSPPCLSLGRNQPAAPDCTRLREVGVDVVRRPTGGRGVLHAQELTYSVVVPDRELGGPRRAYVAINAALVEGVRRLGVGAATVAAAGAPSPGVSNAPCFAEPAPGEVLAAGRKLIGSAQRRTAGVLLQHGSLPLRRTHLEEIVFGGSHPGPTYLESVLDPLPGWEDLTRALTEAWSEAFGELQPSALDDGERMRAMTLAPFFADDAWTWRR